MSRSARASGASSECGRVIGPSEARRCSDETPRNAERSLDFRTQRANTECLGRVVPDIQPRDPELLSVHRGGVRALPNDQCVDLRCARLTERLTRGTGARADGPTRGSPFRSHADCDELSTLPTGKLGTAIRKRVRSQLACALQANLDRFKPSEPGVRGETKLACEQRIVAKCWMEIERQVRRVHGDVVCDQPSNALVDLTADWLRSSPEQAMVDDQQIGAILDRAIDR